MSAFAFSVLAASRKPMKFSSLELEEAAEVGAGLRYRFLS
jgi:hypothetical protein